VIAPDRGDTIADPHRRDRVVAAETALDFNVKRIESVTVAGPPALMQRDLMSPYVWREDDGRWGLMVRATVRAGAPLTDTGQIWLGWSDDGTQFTMLDAPAITPGPDEEDVGGVEDPTVVRQADGYVVYYSGVRADHAHGDLCYASGASLDRLRKQGVALASSKSEGNTKEATVDRTADGRWRLFYEYAADEASRVGVAIGPSVAGPWSEQPTPFMPRDESWDDWHLSTGPLLTDDPATPVMFYNGATRDARWRIGWVAFDADYARVVARGIEPLITPPPVADRSATDIAFAASVVVEEGAIWLYYSLEDRRLARALIRRS
jgi:predicted GH43/DUF377 family glycosyl hydrolase